MELAIVNVVLIALLALTFWARTRQFRRANLEIIERLREHGALREGK